MRGKQSPYAAAESALFFNETLAALGDTQTGFARRLAELGDERKPVTILRHVQRIANGEAVMSAEMRVLLKLISRGTSAIDRMFG